MKRKLITWGIVSVIIVVGLLGLFILSSSSADVTAFSLDDFREEMEWHSADLVLGEVSSAKEAKSMALEVFKNEYGFNVFSVSPTAFILMSNIKLGWYEEVTFFKKAVLAF